MNKTKADMLYESLANFTDEEGAIECGAKMRDYARKLECDLASEISGRNHFQSKITDLEREVKIWSDQSTLNATRWDDAMAEKKRLVNGIKSILTENAHLADGEICTLRELKRLVPEWESEFLGSALSNVKLTHDHST